MANNKNKETDLQQTTQNQETQLNPFRDAAPAEDPQQLKEEEIEMEQQRKDALTERD